jgi:hypothetical protein
VERRYDLSAPQGVRGRNSDNTLIQAELGWAPSIRLETGLAETYKWIYDQLTTSQANGHKRSALQEGAITRRPASEDRRR